VAHGPIDNYIKVLIQKNIANQNELDQIDRTAETEIEEAIKFAEASPEPADEDLFKDIYIEE
jgi:pyruvate dehydrogenase E1 component alpha subunit